MLSLTANELKTGGVSTVDKLLQKADEVAISVRGKSRYVVMDIEKYARLREYELSAALQEARADVAAGHYHTDTVAEHLRRIDDGL